MAGLVVLEAFFLYIGVYGSEFFTDIDLTNQMSGLVGDEDLHMLSIHGYIMGTHPFPYMKKHHGSMVDL